MIVRYSKIAMTTCLGLVAFLVVFTNLTDSAGNWPFVRHVMSMDTTFRDPAVSYRAITVPLVWELGYASIILGEAVTCALLLAAAWRMFSARRAAAPAFNRSKSLLHLGALAGFLVWFLGFMGVGGEWFLMWQSQIWDGREPAFRFYATILLVLIYVMQPDEDLAGNRAQKAGS